MLPRKRYPVDPLKQFRTTASTRYRHQSRIWRRCLASYMTPRSIVCVALEVVSVLYQYQEGGNKSGLEELTEGERTRASFCR